MKSLMLLAASCFALMCVVSRGQDGAERSARTAATETTTAPAVPQSPTRKGKDFAYWGPRMLPPFTDAERIEAMLEVSRLVIIAHSRPDGTVWVTDVVVPPMTQLLHDESSEVRATAAGIFASDFHELGKRAIPDLTQLLKDEDTKVRRAAVQALGGMGKAAEACVPEIVKMPREDARMIAARADALQRMGPKGMDAFLAMLDDPNDEIRSVAVGMLGTWNISKEIKLQLTPKFLKLLRDPSASVRAAAVSVAPPTAKVLPAMIELLHDKDAQVRARAAFSIPPVGEAVPGVVELLKDDDPKVSGSAKIKLTKMAGVVSPLPPEMVKLARDPDSWIRSNLAMNLDKAGAQAIPTLMSLLDDENSVVRGAAAESLREIGRPAKEAVPALKALLTDHGGAIRRRGGGKWLVCHAAAEALNEIIGGNYLHGLPPIPADGK